MKKLTAAQFLPRDDARIPDFTRYGALASNWAFSASVIRELRNKLAGNLSGNVLCVALAGSFGRLEGSKSSDADYILVVKDKDEASVGKDRDTINQTIAALGIAPPNKSGVFATPRTTEELIGTIGNPGENVDILGKRLLLLLESRPIYGDGDFLALLENILDKYFHYHSKGPTKEFAFLLNDLIRYFRYICVNYQSNFWRENEKWAVRNLKLRHSRVLMYSGLLFVIGEASKHAGNEKLGVLANAMPLAPLERLAFVYDQNHDQSFFRLAGLYNVFLARLSNEEIRKNLSALEYDDRYSAAEFGELKANSDAFVAEMLRFVMARHGTWSERFFEYLIF